MESLLSKHCVETIVTTQLEENFFISRNGVAEVFGLFYSVLSNETETATCVRELLKAVQGTTTTPIDALIACYAESIRDVADVRSSTLTASMTISLSSIIRHCKYNPVEENPWSNFNQ